ncbi:MAG: type VI secretion system Vgr family protein, partial [Pyrinomonadaceae bacterium]
MATYTQENRRIQVITPLGDDVLLLQSFSGHEGVSTLFQFDLAMHSENREIKFDDIIGKKATIRIIDDVGKERYVNGIISSFAQSGASSIFAYYRATLVPWTWLLTRTTDCRIFQNKTVPDIIEKIFDERGFKDYKNELSGSFTEREYCVQYRETSFNFVSRLMQEEGIFYYFRHEEDTHTLVLANNPSAFKPCPNQAEARYEPVEGAGYTEDVVTQWSIGQEVRPGKYSIVDFDFEKPLLDLTAGVDGADARKYEIYDYPGEYKTKSEGEGLVGIRMQEEEATRILASGSSTCRFFTTGYKFDFKDHYRKDLNKTYVLTSVYHTADAGSNYEPDAGDALEYTNQFQCIPHPTPFRPPRTAPVPVVHGTQTAIVVGPSGEEIYVDKYGRVKVQF